MIDDYLSRLEGHLKDIKGLLNTIAGKADSGTNASEPEYIEEFIHLKGLVEGAEWPVAVDPSLICDESRLEDRESRARSILDFLVTEPLEGKKFLDFGCGEGLVVVEAGKKGATLAVGYDIEQQWSDEGSFADDTSLTTRWSGVKEHAPFDVVMVWDVLDHTVAEPVDLLRKIHEVCHGDTRVYVRCHPWCSRSATHTYRAANKAYTHLVFSDIEQVRLGITGGIPTRKVIHPQMDYTRWFQDAGFQVLNTDPMTEELEEFFRTQPLVSARIKKNWSGSHDPALASGAAFPHYQVRIQSLDFHLRIK